MQGNIEGEYGKEEYGKEEYGKERRRKNSKVGTTGDALSSCSEIFKGFFCPFDSAAIPISG